MGVVNIIMFVDNNRRFVILSDDKFFCVWEFGISVVIKYISEFYMYFMFVIFVYSNGKWFAA